MNQPGIGNKIVTDLVKRFPNAGAQTIAKKAFNENPAVWSSLNAASLAVRRRLGVQGSRSRKLAADQSSYREPRQSGWSEVIPPSIEQIEDWSPIQIDGPHRSLILSDIHIPFHDENALELALEYGEKRKPTLILINGDLGDHYAESKFEKDPRQKDFPGEVRATKFFLRGLRKRFPRARIIYKLGNHDERYSLYLRMKCPELLGIPDFEFKSVYDLDAMKIEVVDQKRPIRLGKMNVIHGHEYTFAISNPVNPARGFYLRAKKHVLGGHLHRTSEHAEGDIEGKVIAAYSTGCLCNLHPEYSPLNNWNHGFAFMETGKDGAFNVDNLKIIKGKVW